MVHNELMNIWTHMLPALVLILILGKTLMNVYTVSDIDVKIFGYFEPKILGMALLERLNELDLDP